MSDENSGALDRIAEAAFEIVKTTVRPKDRDGVFVLTMEFRVSEGELAPPHRATLKRKLEF